MFEGLLSCNAGLRSQQPRGPRASGELGGGYPAVYGEDDPDYSLVFGDTNDGIDGVLALAPLAGLGCGLLRVWRFWSRALLVRTPSRLGNPRASGGLGGGYPAVYGEDDPDYSVVFGNTNDGIDGVLAPASWWPVWLRCVAHLEAGLSDCLIVG